MGADEAVYPNKRIGPLFAFLLFEYVDACDFVDRIDCESKNDWEKRFTKI